MRLTKSIKIIILILFYTFLGTLGYSQNNVGISITPDKKEKPKISKLTTVFTEPNGNKSEGIGEYDNNGNLIKEVTKKYDGQIEIITFTYDKANKLIQQDVMLSDKLLYNILFSYDTKGNLSKVIVKNTGGNISETNYEYKNNVLEKHVEKNSDGSTKKTTYEYDKSGKMSKSTEVFSNGDLFVTKYEYNSKDDLVKLIHTYADKSIHTATFDYERDKKDRIIKTIYKSTDGYSFTHTFEYADK